MSEVDPVILELRAENGRYISEIRKATETVEKALGKQERSAKRLERQMQQSTGQIGSAFRGLAATLATAFTGRELAGMIDSFTRLQNNLKVAGLEGENLAGVQERLLDLSGRYGVSVENLSSVFLKAALVQKELGASTDQIIQLNEITAASLKITGTSAQEASGALLQLGQALGSGIVRAEEFNSILEGALPLAQAAARGIDGYGGSVSKLRAAIADGKITSEQFFQGVLKGGVQTLADAEKATLTLSGAMEALSSRLTVYIGESAKANGATTALAGAIELLADNIETIIPALAVLATGLGVGLVTNAVRARIAMAATATGATGMAAAFGVATAAGRGMMAVLGGPVGIAITALAVGIAYLASESANASAAIKDLEISSQKAADDLTDLERRAKAAGVEIKGTGDAAESAQSGLTGLNHTISSSIDFYNRLTKSARLAAVAIANTDLQKAESRRRDLRERLDSSARNVTGAAEGVVVDQGAVSDAFYNVHNGKKLDKEIKDLRARVVALSNLSDDDYSKLFPETPSSAPPGKDKKKKKGRSGPSAEDIEARFSSELSSLAQQTLSAQRSLANSAEERAELELRSIELARLNTLESIRAEADYTDAQKERLIQQVEALADFEREAVERERYNEVLREQADLAQTRAQIEQKALRDEFDLADTQAERRDIAMRIVDAYYASERAALESAKLEEGISEARKAELQLRLDALDAARNAETERARRDTAGPMEAYLDDLTKASATISEDIEGIAVESIKGLNSGLADAIVNGENLGDVLEDTGKRFLAQLIEIGLQLLIIKPLMESLGGGMGGGGGGGLFGAIGSIFGGGRASGGPVSAGQVYRFNESGQEYFRPSVDGSIVPAGRVNAMAQSAGGGSVQGAIRIYLSDDIDARIESVSGPIAVEVVRQTAPAVIDAAVSETFNRSSKPRL